MPITSWLRSGVFYAIVATVATPVRAELSAREVDRLERVAWTGVHSTDPVENLAYLDAFDRLRAHYESTHRVQELIWLLSRFDYPREAEALEKDLLRRLAEEPIRGLPRRLDEANARVLGVTLESGVRAVLMAPDLRWGDQSFSANVDLRRNAVTVYDIDRAGRFNVVPATTYREINGYAYVIRAFITDVMPFAKDYRRDPYDDDALHALDYVSKQIDRNRGGVGWRPGGYTVALDNKHSVSLDEEGAKRLFPDMASLAPPRDISEDTHAALVRLEAALDSSVTGGKNQFLNLNLLMNRDVRGRVHTARGAGIYPDKGVASPPGLFNAPARAAGDGDCNLILTMDLA